MGMTRGERKLYHEKQKKDSGGSGVPQASTMEEGVSVFRTTASGVIQYIKIGGVLYQSIELQKVSKKTEDATFLKNDLAAAGYVKFQNRFMMQWGTIYAIGAVTFEVPFAATCFGVFLGKHTTDNDQIPFVKSVTKTGFSYDTDGSTGTHCHWLAIGK